MRASSVTEEGPKPRDGHVAMNLGNNMFVFGGDRHQVPFNDLFFLPLGELWIRRLWLNKSETEINFVKQNNNITNTIPKESIEELTLNRLYYNLYGFYTFHTKLFLF